MKNCHIISLIVLFFIMITCESPNSPKIKEQGVIFSFSLQQSSYVKLSIENVIGDKVCTLISQYLDPGEHSVTWYGKNDDGEYVEAGLYFYVLEVVNSRTVTKIIIIE